MKLFPILFLIFQPILRVYGDQCGIYSAGVLIQQLTYEKRMASVGLFFDEKKNKLYFANFYDPAVCVIDGETANYNCTPVPDVKWITAAIPIKYNDNELIGLADNSIKSLYLKKDENGNIESIITKTKNVVITDPKYEFTDSKVDKEGRIWIDIVTDVHNDLSGKVLQVNQDNTIIEAVPAAMFPEGIAFSSNNKEFFHVDSEENVVKRYDLDVYTGIIKNPEVVFNTTDVPYFEGYVCSVATTKTKNVIWIGVCESGMIIKYNINRKEYEQVHKIPALYPVSLEMGGPGLNVLFVGTMKGIYDNTLNAGQVYAISATGTKGVASNKITV